MNKKNVGIAIAGVIIITGASFWGGVVYAKGQRGQFGAGGTFAGRQAGGGFRASTNGAVFGSIVSKDTDSITVALGGPMASSTNGNETGSKIVILDNNTQVGKFVTGSVGDLSVGESVMVAGTPNSDGSVTAQMIQIRPAGQTYGQRGAQSNYAK